MTAARPDPAPARGGRRPLWAGVALALALSGCSLAPSYQRPAMDLPAAYKEAAPGGPWQPAAPGDQLPRGEWWKLYGDATLDALERRLDAANPDLASALARYRQASAFESQLRAGLLPHLGAGASPQHERQSDNRPLRGAGQPDEYDSRTAEADAGYELDLWGRIRNEVAAGKARAQAAAADLASARLSLEARLADDYIRLRGYDIQARILADSIEAYRQALELTRNRFEGGIASELDVTRARTQLSDAQAQATEVAAQRALAEHAIASLVGEPASRFSLPAAPVALQVPSIPAGVPSTLLQRRPDIAAAERRTYAANAGIGVARAAFFPSLSLSAAFGWQDTANGSLLSAGNRFWALGPLATLEVFDGGLRRARVREARAALDEAAGHYRSTVLAAFQQVEDDLALLDRLGREAGQEEDAAEAARQSQAIATNRYREGAVSYLDVVAAQTSALQAERSAEAVRTRRLQASVDLVRALGGGWSEADAGTPGGIAKAGQGGKAPAAR